MPKNPKAKIIAIVGPTAIGKSDYAVKLAQKINGEVISADSRQVYTGLDVSSGKVTKKEMAGVPHYMIDVVSPKKVFSAFDFRTMALPIMEDIIARGKTPIVVGGTGFYIDALLGTVTLPEVPPNTVLRKKLSSLSTSELFEKLQKLDPTRASEIDAQNPARLVRAIEIATLLGTVPKKKVVQLPYQIVWIGLTASREKLREKIAVRTKKQIYQGMIEEIATLHAEGLSWKRLCALGLEQRLCALFLQKKISAIELEKMLLEKIYQYAIRQLRWFKRNKEIGWIEVKK